MRKRDGVGVGTDVLGQEHLREKRPQVLLQGQEQRKQKGPQDAMKSLVLTNENLSKKVTWLTHLRADARICQPETVRNVYSLQYSCLEDSMDRESGRLQSTGSQGV